MASQKASITMETSTAATTIESFLGGDTSVSTGIGDTAAIDTSALDIGAAPVFGVDAAGKAQIGGNGFFITTTGTDAQKAAAWDFLKWWNEEPQQVQWHVEGSVPAVPDRRRLEPRGADVLGPRASPAAS